MIYLDNAATTRFKPLSVKHALLKELSHSANPGRAAHLAGISSAMKVESCRESISAHFFDGNVIFTKNCTEALNLGILGSTPSGQVITTVYEHNSVLRPLHYLTSIGKIRLKVIAPGRDGWTAALTAALKTPTSLLVLSNMSNVTGEVIPVSQLAALAKERMPEIKILIDTAQSAGHITPDFTHIDMIATAGHKGLHGAQGTGFLLMKKQLSLSPLLRGGTGTSSLSLDHPRELPESLEAGTLNTPGIAALSAGIEWTFRHMETIKKRTKQLGNFLIENSKDIPALKLIGGQNGIYLFQLKGMSSSTVSDILSSEYGICVRSGLHCAPLMHKYLGTVKDGGVRVSFGYKTNTDDLEKLLSALDKICHK